MVITKADVNPTLIPNTTMQKVFRDGTHTVYYITPNAGYVLHDSAFDFEDMDGNQFLGYRTTTASCAANYDFAVNPRQFFAVPENEVLADQIFNNPT